MVPDLVDFVQGLAEEDLGFAMLFMVFAFLTSLTLMNLLVGMLVEVVSLVSVYEREQLDAQFVKGYFATLVDSLDPNADKVISLAEFNDLMHEPLALKSLSKVGVDVMGLVELGDFMFRGKDHMELVDFMDLVLQLRGSNK